MRGTSFKNWLVTVIGLLFSGVGLAIALRKGDPGGLAVAGFFGCCAAVGIWSLRRERQMRRHAQALAIEIAEGVPLRRRGSEMAGWAALLVVSGAATTAMPGRAQPFFLPIGIGVAGLGVVLGVLLAAGKLKGPALVFEEAGLRLIERRCACLVEWSNIARVSPGEIAGHDLLLIDVRDPARLTATASPPSGAPWLAKRVASNRSWYGADVVLMAMMFGTDSVALAKAMLRYWMPPDGSRLTEAPGGAGATRPKLR